MDVIEKDQLRKRNEVPKECPLQLLRVPPFGMNLPQVENQFWCIFRHALMGAPVLRNTTVGEGGGSRIGVTDAITGVGPKAGTPRVTPIGPF